MYLKKLLNKKSGRTYLSICHNSYDKDTKKVRAKTIRPLGYLDSLEKEYPDPIAYFTQVAAQMHEEFKAGKAELIFRFRQGETLASCEQTRKNLGYAVLSHLYAELGLNLFLNNKQRYLHADYKLNTLFRLLVFSRIIAPASKKKTYENREMFFEKTAYSLDSVYRSLSDFARISQDIQLLMHRKAQELYGRQTEVVYYDVTNYYFEIDEPDDIRKKGVGKEHRPNPIVQMGLLMDKQGLPITYKLFSGNTNDCQTLMPVLADVRKDYGIGRFIVVADKGLNTSNNTCMARIKGDGYIFSQSVLKATRELREYVLDEQGYVWQGEEFKIKSRQALRTVRLENDQGEMVETFLEEKQIIFYSEKYAQRSRKKREETLCKARDLIAHPSKYSQRQVPGAAKYVKDLRYDTKTGEIILKQGQLLSLNQDKITQEEELDGYYAIVTSELDKSDGEIIDLYRGLWKIEESFKVTKSDLEARPVYVSHKDHIEAHFLICFVALFLLRLLEKRTNNQYSTRMLIETMQRITGTYLQDNYYMLDHRSEVTDALGETFGIDFSKRFMQLKEIQSYTAMRSK